MASSASCDVTSQHIRPQFRVLRRCLLPDTHLRASVEESGGSIAPVQLHSLQSQNLETRMCVGLIRSWILSPASSIRLLKLDMFDVVCDRSNIDHETVTANRYMHVCHTTVRW